MNPSPKSHRSFLFLFCLPVFLSHYYRLEQITGYSVRSDDTLTLATPTALAVPQPTHRLPVPLLIVPTPPTEVARS